MTGQTWIWVVCADHGIRYPSSWRGCPECDVSNDYVSHKHGHSTQRVRLR